MSRRLRALALVLACCVPVLGACAAEEPTCPAAPFAARGPWVAGVTTLEVEGVAVEIWYPAAPGSEAGVARDVYDMRDALPPSLRDPIPADAPTRFETMAYRDLPVAADGPFPVVYFSHGLGGYRQQSSEITAHFATWGFVVVAPEHVERNLGAVLLAAMGEGSISDDAYGQILAAHQRLAMENRSGRLAGALDLDRVAVMGHSAGGGAVQALVDDSSLGADSWIGLATVAAPLMSDAPGLLMGGTLDTLATPMAMSDLFTNRVVASSARLIEIADAGHLAFSDICVVGRERGGVLRIAQDAGLVIDALIVMLATDGCQPEALPAEEAWPPVRHYGVAHLRATLGVSEPSAGVGGFEAEAASCFGARIDRVDTR